MHTRVPLEIQIPPTRTPARNRGNSIMTMFNHTTTNPLLSNMERNNSLHQVSQDMNVGLQIINGFATQSLLGTISLLATQTLVSAQTFSHHPNKISRMQLTVHGIQALLSFTMLLLAIMDYLDSPHTKDLNTTKFAVVRALLNSIYQGVLVVDWGPTRVKDFISTVKHRQQLGDNASESSQILLSPAQNPSQESLTLPHQEALPSESDETKGEHPGNRI